MLDVEAGVGVGSMIGEGGIVGNVDCVVWSAVPVDR